MKAITFDEVNIIFGKGQEDIYQPLPSCVEQNCENGDNSFRATMCFELTEEEKEEIVKTGKIWLSVLTFGQPIQPIRSSILKPNPLIPNLPKREIVIEPEPKKSEAKKPKMKVVK